MNERTCFWFVGGVIFTMASIFLTGRIPIRVTHKSRYSILLCPKNVFLILHLSLFSLIFFSNSSNLFNWSEQSPLVIINMSSMYALINYIMMKISLLFSWKMSRKLHTPIVRHLYLYFTNGRIIVHKLLAYLLRRKW